MMSCRQVARRIASGQLADAGRGTRLAVRLHLLMCRHCRRYAAQLAAIGAAARNLLGETPIPSRELEEAIVQRCCLETGQEPDGSDPAGGPG